MSTSPSTFSLANAADHVLLATDLTKFIRENRLVHNVSGKEYVNVEAWQYAGSRLGIVPIVGAVTDLSTAEEIKYMASVTLLDLRTNQTVGAGTMICSNKENGKKFYAEYAIASMAQTRAIGKAFRNVIAFLIRLAGFEATPAEEMDFLTTPAAPKAQPVATPVTVTPEPVVIDPAQVEAYTIAMHACIELTDLQQLWGTIPGIYQHQLVGVKNATKDALTPRTTVEYDPEQESTVPVVTPTMGGDEPRVSEAQKVEIIRLLNNPVIRRAEKTKMLLNLGKLPDPVATITKLRQTITDREEQNRRYLHELNQQSLVATT